MNVHHGNGFRVNGSARQKRKSTTAILIATALDLAADQYPGIDTRPLAKILSRVFDVGGGYVGLAQRLSERERRAVLNNERPVIMPRIGMARVLHGNGAEITA